MSLLLNLMIKIYHIHFTDFKYVCRRPIKSLAQSKQFFLIHIVFYSVLLRFCQEMKKEVLLEKFKDTEVAIKSRKSKNRHYKGQNKITQ